MDLEMPQGSTAKQSMETILAKRQPGMLFIAFEVNVCSFNL
jgi:hypothetical protein